MTFTIDVSQLEALAPRLQQYVAAVQDEVSMSGVAAMAEIVYDEVRQNAERNKLTGLLQSAIYRAYSPEKSGDDVKQYRVSWNKRKAPHGHLVEFGHARAPAYPFLRPAVSILPYAIEAGKKRIAERLDRLEVAP